MMDRLVASLASTLRTSVGYADPAEALVVLAICLGIALLAGLGVRKSAVAGLLAGYVWLVISSTVLGRARHAARAIKAMPRWSWWEVIANGRVSLLAENLLNVAMTIPVGLLMQPLLGDRVSGWQRVGLTVGVSAMLEVAIEASQYFLLRGLAEWDDVIHGVVGALLGLAIWAVGKKLATL